MEKAISWMWGIPFSFTLGMIVAGLGGFFFRSPSPDRIQGLTYGDRRAP